MADMSQLYDGTINNGRGIAPPGQNYSKFYDGTKSVAQFVNNPSPTIKTFEEAGLPELPFPTHMIGGLPFPHSAQTRLGHWNRATGGGVATNKRTSSPTPWYTLFNAPRSRMTQT